MPLALRALAALLVVAFALDAVRAGSTPLDDLIGGTPDEVLYDSVLIGSAVLCLARAALHVPERTAWSVMGLGMLAYALGNVVWCSSTRSIRRRPIPPRRTPSGSSSTRPPTSR